MLRRILAKAPTYLENTREDPRWLLMFTLGRFVRIRDFFSPRPVEDLGSADADSMFDADRRKVVGDLKTFGIHTDLNLPSELARNIRRFADRTPCYANFDREKAFLPSEHERVEQSLQSAVLTGHYLDSVENCDEIKAIRSDPLLVQIAQAYLGHDPKVASTRMWWSFSSRKSNEEDLHLASQGKMHFDLDDWRALKFFFYLTDVGPDDGPHVYMKGTHNRRMLRHQFTPVVGHETSKVVELYGRQNKIELCGRAGFGFVEDPFAFHMGQVSRGQPRLMLEIGFGVSAAAPRRFYGDLVLH